MAHAPREKAVSHFKRFADLMTRVRDDVEFVRTVARAACRAPDPITAAEGFIAKYDALVTELTSTGVESSIARSLAAIASLSAEPLPAARKLLQNFEAVLVLAKETHPQVARSIALSACRASEPLRTARLYMNNYDTIIRVIGETDAGRASVVASQAFRSDNPLRWARRYLAQLQAQNNARKRGAGPSTRFTRVITQVERQHPQRVGANRRLQNTESARSHSWRRASLVRNPAQPISNCRFVSFASFCGFRCWSSALNRRASICVRWPSNRRSKR
jgi:hypothetical protein